MINLTIFLTVFSSIPSPTPPPLPPPPSSFSLFSSMKDVHCWINLLHPNFDRSSNQIQILIAFRASHRWASSSGNSSNSSSRWSSCPGSTVCLAWLTPEEIFFRPGQCVFKHFISHLGSCCCCCWPSLVWRSPLSTGAKKNESIVGVMRIN